VAMENVKAFFEKLNQDKTLAEKLAVADKAFGEKHKGEEKNEATRLAAAEEIIIPVAKEAGFNFTVDDMVAFEASNLPDEDEEIDDGELAQVAGGNGAKGVGFTLCFKVGIGIGGSVDTTNGEVNECCLFGVGGLSGCAYFGGSLWAGKK